MKDKKDVSKTAADILNHQIPAAIMFWDGRAPYLEPTNTPPADITAEMTRRGYFFMRVPWQDEDGHHAFVVSSLS